MHRALLLSTAAACVLCAPALAQTNTSDDRAVERAADAFGLRVGVEQIGLYSESQVRGFSLQEAGNYRINGAYFVRSAAMVDQIISGVVTRVGLNALDADFATPSGIVDYRLKSPFETPSLSMELSRREYGGQFYDLGVSGRSEDGKAAGFGGVQALLGVSSSGVSNRHHRYGFVGELRPDADTRLTAFGSLQDFNLQGSYGFSAAGDSLPPRLEHPRRYLPNWGDHDGMEMSGGLIGSTRLGETIDLGASAAYSYLNIDRSDFALLSTGETGIGRATGVSNRPRHIDSLSGSITAGWRHAPGRRLYGELRARRSVNRFAPAVSVDLGRFDQAEGLLPSVEPHLPAVARTRDAVDQMVAGVGYEATFGQLRLKGGLQKAVHTRTFAVPEQIEHSATERPWLYEASMVWALSPDWTVFATATRGLEESGTAPNHASNRNEVLPAAISTQQELGVRGRLGLGMTLIASAFSIEKPALGFDADNAFRLIGELRHRGLEASLTGRPTKNLRVIAGAAFLEARRSGPPVDQGVWSAEAVGIPELQLMGGVTYSVPALPGLSLDSQVSHQSSRRARSVGELRSSPYTTVDVGALYAFRYADKDMAVRARLANLFDTDVWVAGRSELLDRPNRRGARISLTLRY